MGRLNGQGKIDQFYQDYTVYMKNSNRTDISEIEKNYFIECANRSYGKIDWKNVPNDLRPVEFQNKVYKKYNDYNSEENSNDKSPNTQTGQNGYYKRPYTPQPRRVSPRDLPRFTMTRPTTPVTPTEDKDDN